MQEPIGSNGSFANVPRIPANLTTASEVAMLIPKGFEDVVKVQIKSDEVCLTLLKDEYQDNVLVIPSSLYNPLKNKVEFPQFLIERSIFQDKIVDYFAEHSDERYIFNQNELLYIVLQHRLLQYLGRPVVYSTLLRKDISAVKSYMQHVPSVAYNAVQKNKNSYIIMGVFDEKRGGFKNDSLLGDIIRFKSYLPSADGWHKLKDQIDIQCSSESGASKIGKLILSPYANGSLYRSVGHSIYYNEDLGIYMMKSLFKSAQNITARNKTHVTANAYEIYDFEPTSNFIEDWVYDKEAYPDLENPVLEGYKPKDHCYKRAVVAIRPMNKENGHYLFGEVEAGPDYYDTFVWEDHKIVANFDRHTLPLDGSIVYAQTSFASSSNPLEEVEVFDPIIVGYTEEGDKNIPIKVYDVAAVKFVKERVTNGPLGKSKVTLRVARRAGNARCDSNTGFKGVTKGKPYCGEFILADGTRLKPDFAFGMNSFKAKHNSIELARAALAVDLGTYQPNHWSGKLNSLDEDEINEASQTLPEYTYYDEFGKAHHNVQMGVIYYRYTEIGEVFKSYRLQALSHETGRNLFHNESKDLFNYLWSNYVEEDMKSALVEFQKTLCSSDVFDGDKELPHYTPQHIAKTKLFDEDRDLIGSTMVNFRSNSILLEDSFNPNGFFLDFRTTNRGPLIRVPSARVLRMFENELETGEWRYHSFFISLSKIIRAVLRKQFNYIFPTQKELQARQNKEKSKEFRPRDTLSDRYLRDIKGVLFTSEESREMNVTALSRPMVPGMAMKQVVDVKLPAGTALIMCDKTYEKAVKNCYGEDFDLQSLQYGLCGFHVRNPSLWRSQLCKVKIWCADDFRAYLLATEGLSLDKYLLTSENHDVIIFSTDVFERSHSDADGDHSAVYVPHGAEGQEIMRAFELSDVCPEEHIWTEGYVAGEYSANESLINEDGTLANIPYHLYDVPLQDYTENRETINSYSTYFFQALEAKENIGSATNDGWIFAMILEGYREYARKHDYKYTTQKGDVINMMRLNDEKFFKYHFSYIRGLQDFVVTGVKHNDNGSKDFESLFLRNIASEKNAKKVRDILQGPLELSTKEAADILRIVTWAEMSGMRLACSWFLKLYNKGSQPSKPEDVKALQTFESFIQQNTYFGKLLKPIYDIIYQNQHAEEIQAAQMKDNMAQLMKDIESEMTM